MENKDRKEKENFQNSPSDVLSPFSQKLCKNKKELNTSTLAPKSLLSKFKERLEENEKK